MDDEGDAPQSHRGREPRRDNGGDHRRAPRRREPRNCHDPVDDQPGDAHARQGLPDQRVGRRDDRIGGGGGQVRPFGGIVGLPSRNGRVAAAVPEGHNVGRNDEPGELIPKALADLVAVPQVSDETVTKDVVLRFGLRVVRIRWWWRGRCHGGRASSVGCAQRSLVSRIELSTARRSPLDSDRQEGLFLL